MISEHAYVAGTDLMHDPRVLRFVPKEGPLRFPTRRAFFKPDVFDERYEARACTVK